MELHEYLGVGDGQVLKAVARPQGYECIVEYDQRDRQRVFVPFAELAEEPGAAPGPKPMPEPEPAPEPVAHSFEVDATDGARRAAREHGISLEELYRGERLTYYDVMNAVEVGDGTE